MVFINTKKTKPVSVTLASLLVLIVFCAAIVPLLHISLAQSVQENDKESPIRQLTKAASSSLSSACCNAAKSESLSFFSDITDTEWLMKKEIYGSTQPNYNKHRQQLRKQMETSSQEFWNNNFEPEFTCGMQRRLGGYPPLGDGGKWVCDPHRIDDETSSCLVYSIGSNGNAMFERSMHNILSHCKELQIHTFDLKSRNNRNGKFKDRVAEAGGEFHDWGITVETMNFTRDDYFLPKHFRGLKFKTFGETFEELGHKERIIDVMKIDCEGCEWQSVEGWLKDWQESGVLVRQLLLEIHDSPPGAVDFFQTLKQAGYVIFHKEVTGTCAEYAFIKMDPSFFLPLAE